MFHVLTRSSNKHVEERKGFGSEAQINKLKKRTGSVQELIKTGRRDQVCTYVKDGKVFCSAAHVKQGEKRWGLVQELSGFSQEAHVNREELM